MGYIPVMYSVVQEQFDTTLWRVIFGNKYIKPETIKEELIS